MRGEPFDDHLAERLQKPPKGSHWKRGRDRRKDAVKAEDAAKAEVRRLDGYRCRWPHCQNCRTYKPPLDVAHVTRAKGMGGDHGTVSTIHDLMVLDRQTHREQETHRREIVYLTHAGSRGPCEFWAEDERQNLYLVAREIAPFVYERD